MKRTSEIRAMDMVRQIRDAQAEQLAGKSAADIIAFFNRAAERTRKKAQSKRVPARTRRGSSR